MSTGETLLDVAENLPTWRKRLRRVRAFHDLTLEEIGEEIGVVGQTISNFEHGRTELTMGSVGRLCLIIVELERRIENWPPDSFEAKRARKAGLYDKELENFDEAFELANA